MMWQFAFSWKFHTLQQEYVNFFPNCFLFSNLFIFSLYDVGESFPPEHFLLHHEGYVYFFISIFFMFHFHKVNDKMPKFIEESKHKTKARPLVIIFRRQIYFWTPFLLTSRCQCSYNNFNITLTYLSYMVKCK